MFVLGLLHHMDVEQEELGAARNLVQDRGYASLGIECSAMVHQGFSCELRSSRNPSIIKSHKVLQNLHRHTLTVRPVSCNF